MPVTRTIRARVALAVTGAVFGLQALLAAGPATAAASGTLILYRNPDFTGVALVRGYSTCAGAATLTAPISSFDNRPLPNCAVTLTTTGASFVLCSGRGVVPPAFRQATRVTIRPGSSRPCGIGTAASA